MGNYYIIIMIAIILVICTLSYIKNMLIYHPLKANNHRYNKFYQKIHNLVESETQIINKMIKTPDNILIDTLYIKNLDTDICIIFFHGNSGNLAMRYDMIKFLYTFASVLIFDYRSFGKSEGSTLLSSDYNLQLDANTVWTYATNILNYSPNKISLFGESLGCSIAISLAADLSKSLKNDMYPHSIILNSPFYSLEFMIKIVSDKLKIGFIGNLLSFFYGKEYKSDNNIQYINHITKIIIAHSPRDEIIPYKEGYHLYKRINNKHPNVKFLNISGTHNNLYLTDAYIYALSDIYQ